MTIELNPQGLARYKPLFNNPIYYFHSLQYVGGDFYRAVLGYETIWDRDYENDLIVSLDKLLTQLNETGEYYFEDVRTIRKHYIQASKWYRGIKPSNPFARRVQRIHHLPSGLEGLARINLVDKPHHVDLEFEDGQIFTISFMRYLTYKEKFFRSKRHEKRTKQNRTDAKDGKRREATKAKGSCRTFTFKGHYVELPRLQQRFGRPTSM